jgi:hypothetical protein
MANIDVEKIQEWVDTLENWIEIDESSASECLVIKFKKTNSKEIIDEEMVNQSLYFQSGNGHVTLTFDETGQISYMEIT